MSLQSLITPDTTIKVSSSLDARAFPKRALADHDATTCWSSQPGPLPHAVLLRFARGTRARPRRLALTFQGGFVGTACAVHVLPAPPAAPADAPGGAEPEAMQEKEKEKEKEKGKETERWRLLTRVYPADANGRQVFDLPDLPSSLEGGSDADADPATTAGVCALKLVFEQSSDLFGRITVYDVDLEGHVL